MQMMGVSDQRGKNRWKSLEVLFSAKSYLPMLGSIFSESAILC
jgi:hypothetical protein